ncbi:MAG: hypothetical protein ACLQOO_00535 [Terriglobia bacterium]
MITLADWLPPTVVGIAFTLVGCLKLYGLRHGMVGGRGQPLVWKLCGT